MSQPDVTLVYRSYQGLKSDWGLDSYRTPSFYEDPRRSIDSLKKRPNIKHKDKLHFKRETFLDDLQKIAKQLPGPSQYGSELIPAELQYKHHKSKSLPKLKGAAELSRNDSISDLIKQKMKIPLVGKYNIIESL